MPQKRPKQAVTPQFAVEMWPIDRPQDYPNNARKWTDKAVAKVAVSIREFGWRQPVVVDSQGVIVIGHLRRAAGKSIGLNECPVHVAADLSPAKIRALRLADNRTAQEAQWDMDMLATEFGEMKALDFDLTLTGFDTREIDKLTLAANPAEDEIPSVPDEPTTQAGDLWLMGGHRLLCGDATKANDHGHVLAGNTPHLVLTDPPYGIGANYASFDDSEANVRTLIDGFMPLVLRWPVVLVTSGHRCMFDYPRPSWFLVWVHPAGNGSGPWGFNLSHPILAYGKDPYLSVGLGSRPDSLVLAADRKGVEGHPTPKPMAVWRWLLDRGSCYSGQNVLDPFGGSGTTVIACEEMERHAFCIELEPRYCDVIVTRWQNLTGKQATLEDDGRTFSEVSDARRRQTEVSAH